MRARTGFVATAVLALACGRDETVTALDVSVVSFEATPLESGAALKGAVGVTPRAGAATCDDCRVDYTIALYQGATGVRIDTLDGSVPLRGTAAHIERTWLAPTSDAYHARLVARVTAGGADLVAGESTPELASFAACAGSRCLFASTAHVCNLVGRAGDPDSAASVPWNHPEGPNPDSPLISGIDLGYPIEHDGRLLIMFGDTITTSPDTGELVPLGRPQQFPLGLAPGNDDAMGFFGDAVAAMTAPTADRCLDLAFFETDSGDADPVTLESPFEIDGTGGSFLGALFVGGGGFSAGGHLFALMPDGREVCRPGAICDHFQFFESCATDADCIEPGDRCLTHSALPDGRTFCFYGDECDAPGAPESDPSPECHPRRTRSLLGASPDATNDFVIAREGEHVELGFYDRPERWMYDGNFAVTSFAEHDARVFAYGRPRGVGSKERPSNVHLAVHEIRDGLLARARYFVGCASSAGVAPEHCGPETRFEDAVFASSPELAAPLFVESRTIVNKHHVSYVEHLGRWVMLYGGRLPLSFINDPSRIWKLSHPTLDAPSNSRPEVGIYLRTAPAPWGPWSDAVTIYSPWSRFGSGYCEIMHWAGSTDPGDGLPDDPPEYLDCDPERNDALDFGHHDHGAEYGPARLMPLAMPFADGASIYWLMSTWNPYRIVIMRSDLSPTPFVPSAAKGALLADGR